LDAVSARLLLHRGGARANEPRSRRLPAWRSVCWS